MSRSKLNTYVNQEPDDVQTGTGKIHLQDYAFQHKVAGQPPVVEWCMRPAPHASHKRYHFTLSVDKPTCNMDQAFAASDSYLRDFHDFLFRHALSKPCGIILDKYARGMFAAANRAVDDVLEVQARQFLSLRARSSASSVQIFSGMPMRRGAGCST